MPDDLRQHDLSPTDSDGRQWMLNRPSLSPESESLRAESESLDASVPCDRPKRASNPSSTFGLSASSSDEATAAASLESSHRGLPVARDEVVASEEVGSGNEVGDLSKVQPCDQPRGEAGGCDPTDVVHATPLSIDRASAGSSADPESRDQSKLRKRSHHADPLTQSLTLLATIAVMLLAARFVVPRIVEEVRYAWHRGELRAEYESGTEGLKNVSLDALSEAYQMVTAAVGPSVVHIDVQRQSLSDDASMAHLLSGSGVPTTDQGSGVVVDADGFVLTNRHVISDGDGIIVTLSDGRQLSAKVVGTDALTDLALLKVDARGLIPITWGDSDRCKVGAPVWAVGSPFGLDRTVTFGILSGKHRMVRASTQYQDFMQSDVAVNPGNSGGPLIDARGTLIGINTAIVGDTYRGVSFSIPSNVAKQVYQQLRESGQVERGWLGVELDEVAYDPASGSDPLLRGAMVGRVTDPDSPAAKAGLQSGDLIVSVDEQRIANMAHLMRLIGGTMAGSQVRLHILRDSEPLDLEVVLGSRPPELNRR